MKISMDSRLRSPPANDAVPGHDRGHDFNVDAYRSWSMLVEEARHRIRLRDAARRKWTS